MLKKLFKKYLNNNLTMSEISSQDIRLCVSQKKIQLFYKNTLLTRNVGFTFVCCRNSIWTDTNRYKWDIQKLSETSLQITISPNNTYIVEQLWTLSIQGNDISYHVQTRYNDEIFLDELKFGVFIDTLFSQWNLGCETGNFPANSEWMDMPLQDFQSKKVAVSTKDSNQLNLQLSFEVGKDLQKNEYLQLQNSSREIMARALFYRILNKSYQKEKNYVIGGKITIEEIINKKNNSQKIHTKRSINPTVVIANLPWFEKDKIGIRAGSRWPHLKDKSEGTYLPFPFFKAYATSLLKKNGYEVVVIDAIAQKLSLNNFSKKIKEIAPYLLVCETSIPSMNNDINILQSFSHMKSKIALCGPNLFIQEQKFFDNNQWLDYVFLGEYEYTLLDLLNALLKTNVDLKTIPGIVFRSENEKIIKTTARELEKNLDNFPWPERKMLPMFSYIDTPGSIPVPSVQMWASRGCPYQCSFCAWPQLMYGGPNYRLRSPEDIVNEMEYLVHEFGFRSIYFDDDTFNVKKTHVLRICDLLIEKRNQGRICVPWAIMARPDLMDEELLNKLLKAGLYAVKYGVESASQQLVDSINKKMDLEQAVKMIELTNQLGIKTHLTFTFGLPGENKDTIKNTIDLALRLNPESVQFSITTPFPGTKFYDDMKNNGHLLNETYSDYDGTRKSVIKTELLSKDDLENARKTAYFLWNEHIKRRSSFYKRFSLLLLTKKFTIYLRSFGISAAIHKSFDFVIFFVKSRIKYYGELIASNKIDSFLLRQERKKSKKPLYCSNKSILSQVWKTFLVRTGIMLGNRALTGPKIVQLDLTNSCDHKCLGCWIYSPLLGDEKISAEKEKLYLSVSKIDEIIKDCKKMGVEEIQISGGGEPLLHPAFSEIVKRIKEHHFKLSIISNGMHLNAMLIKQLCEYGVDLITISLWASDEFTFIKLHHGKKQEDFYKLKSNIKQLVSFSQQYTTTKIKIYNVVCHYNAKFITQMLAFAKELSVDYLEFTPIDISNRKQNELVLTEDDKHCILQQFQSLVSEKEYFGHEGISFIDEVSTNNAKELKGFGKYLKQNIAQGFTFDFSVPRIFCPKNKANNSLHVKKNDKNIFVADFINGKDSLGNTIKNDVCETCEICITHGKQRLYQFKYLEIVGVGTFLRRIQSMQGNSYDHNIIDELSCCPIGWLFSRISPEGNVYFCCKATQSEIGNINTERFEHIWYGEKLNTLRKQAKFDKKDTTFFHNVNCKKVCDNIGYIMKYKNKKDIKVEK